MTLGTPAKLVLAAGAVSVIAGCGSGSPSSSSSQPQTLRIAVAAPIQNLSPTGMSASTLIDTGIAEMLIRPLPDGTVQPWLLQSYQNTSPTTWTLTVRPNVKFQDGHPVTAEAVADCLKAIIKGAAFHDSIIGSTITAAGNTVTITTPTPQAFVPFDLANQSRYPIFDASAVQAAGNDVDALTAAGIYTGPFQPTSLTTTHLTARAYRGYWNGPVALPGVDIEAIQDPSARVAAVQSGSVDIALGPPVDAPKVLQGSTTAFYRKSPQALRSTTMIFNENQAPFNDPMVREAFALGIDYKQVAAATNDFLTAATGFSPSSLPWSTPDQMTDVQEAKSVLAADGWTAGSDGILTKNGQKLSFTYLWGANDGRPDEETVGLSLRDQLRNIGMDVNVTSIPSMFNIASVPSNFGVGVFPVTIQGIGNNPTESILDVFIFHLNVGGINNPQLKALVFQIGSTFDASQRTTLLGQMNSIIESNHLAVQLGFAPIAVVTDATYKNFTPDSEGFLVGPKTVPS
jgi:peptide/nickel transport system substrate-binding protein